MYAGFRIIVGLVTALTVFGSGYEMVLERRNATELKKRQINQENNNEGDSKIEFTLNKVHGMEKMNMKGSRNDDGTMDKDDLMFKGNTNGSILL